MTKVWRIGCLWACAVAAGAAVADAQVVVHLKNGQKMVGESVLREGEDVLEIKICHSHTEKIPQAAVLRHESFAPAPAMPRAAAQPAARTRLDDAQRVHREKLIREFLAGTERRAEVLAEIRRDDAVPRQDVDHFGEFILRAVKEAGPKLREGDFVFDHPIYKGQVHVEVHKGTNAPAVPAATVAKAETSTQPATVRDGEAPYALVLLLHGGGQGDGHCIHRSSPIHPDECQGC